MPGISNVAGRRVGGDLALLVHASTPWRRACAEAFARLRPSRSRRTATCWPRSPSCTGSVASELTAAELSRHACRVQPSSTPLRVVKPGPPDDLIALRPSGAASPRTSPPSTSCGWSRGTSSGSSRTPDPAGVGRDGVGERRRSPAMLRDGRRRVAVRVGQDASSAPSSSAEAELGRRDLAAHRGVGRAVSGGGGSRCGCRSTTSGWAASSSSSAVVMRTAVGRLRRATPLARGQPVEERRRSSASGPLTSTPGRRRRGRSPAGVGSDQVAAERSAASTSARAQPPRRAQRPEHPLPSAHSASTSHQNDGSVEQAGGDEDRGRRAVAFQQSAPHRVRLST